MGFYHRSIFNLFFNDTANVLIVFSRENSILVHMITFARNRQLESSVFICHWMAYIVSRFGVKVYPFFFLNSRKLDWYLRCFEQRLYI